ncbi:MAG: GNAT family N-acetyltransferase [Promethearchaeota archaeon]|nr:MAG: GNAT family N-acetyltransferase [Candidatus Lokiarchaeota archaeon]
MMIFKEFSMKYYKDLIQIWRESGVSVGSSDEEDQIKKVLDRNPNLFLVGIIDNKVIAVVIGAFDGRRGYVHHLAVSPKSQNKGYGRKLMEELNERFRNLNVHKVHLFIEKYNEGVINFYKKLGWEIRDDLIMMSYVPNTDLYKREI